MCKATLDFVEHQQSTSLASLLQRRPAQRLQHVTDTRGVPKPVEDEACRSRPLSGGSLASNPLCPIKIRVHAK